MTNREKWCRDLRCLGGEELIGPVIPLGPYATLDHLGIARPKGSGGDKSREMTTNNKTFGVWGVRSGLGDPLSRYTGFCPAGVRCGTEAPQPYDYTALVFAGIVLVLLVVGSLITAVCGWFACVRWRRRGVRASAKADKKRHGPLHRHADKSTDLTLPTIHASFSSWPSGVNRNGSPANVPSESRHFLEKRRWHFRTTALQPGDFFTMLPDPVTPAAYEALDQRPVLVPDPLDIRTLPIATAMAYVVSPEEYSRLIECHLGHHKDGAGADVAWTPHWASRLRPCSFRRRNDVGIKEKQRTLCLDGFVDVSVATMVMAARPNAVITRAQVIDWYSKNNRFLLTADADVRSCTALWIEWLTSKRAATLRGFGHPPQLE